MAAGAYRGYGATQGIFALESAVNELAERLGIDPTVIRENNMIRERMKMPAYYGETANACALDKCMTKCKELFHWDEKYPVRETVDGKVSNSGSSYGDARLLYLQSGCRIGNGKAGR